MDPMPVQYELVFDVAEAGYRQWWFPASGLLFAVIGAGMIVVRRLRPPTQPHDRSGFDFPYAYTGFALLWTLATFVSTYGHYAHLRDALRDRTYKVVEGAVTDFKPMPYEGHQNERFVVSGHGYGYSDHGVTAGFNHTSSHGGPIHPGLWVRIADVDGTIARLEIAR